ncbi:hypothetical protein GCM10029992_24740 [Glycomyces albus]
MALVGRSGEAEARLEGAGLADRALGQQGADAADDGVEPHPHRLHQEQPALVRDRDEPLGLGRVYGEGLLEQHRLPQFEGGLRELEMGVVGGGDVDQFDLVGGEEPLDVQGRGYRVAGGERRGALGVAAGDGDQLDLVAQREVRRDGLSHPSGADHSDPKGRGIHAFSIS